MRFRLEDDVADQTRLLRVEIYLKVYVLALVLCGCVFLDFVGVFRFFEFPVRRIGASLLLFVALNAIYLYLLKKAIHSSWLYVFVGITDIFFFTVLIHYMGGAETPVLAFLYFLPVPFFSICVSRWSGYLVSVGSCIAYSLLCGLEFAGVLHFYGGGPVSLERIGIILFFLFFCFFSVTFYIGYFSEILRKHREALANAYREIEGHNQTLEDRIARRTHELERAREKLQAYSQELEQAYNEKSIQLEEVQKRLASSLSELTLKYDYENIVGRSRCMQDVFRLLDKVTDFSVPVLIQGASGTGKELVAKAIHYNGPRKDQPFVSQNCSAITDTLLESELFGHVKGAFTGAYQDRKGLFEEADRGTLFLDEIGDMSPSMQAKLLRALEDGEIRPVGGKRAIRVDVRILSASNKDLRRSVEGGSFREDLYYRINGVTISLPPLSERREDILLLAEHFLLRFAEETGMRARRLSEAAQRLLVAYDWPGNVRELENTIKNASVISSGEEIEVEDFRYKPELLKSVGIGEAPVQLDASEGVTAGEEKGARTARGGGVEGKGGRRPPGPELPQEKGAGGGVGAFKTLREAEREVIEEALRLTGGKRKEAAELLGIPVRTLYEKIKRYGLR